MDGTVCLDTEIRKLKPAHRYTLAQILNVSDSWKILMSMISKEDTKAPRFTNEHISIIQQAACHSRNAAEIFLDEWGTMGKKRPTIRTLLDLSTKAELFRVADYIAVDILNVDLPKRPTCGPAAPVDFSDESLVELLNEQAILFGNKSNSSSMVGSTFQVNTGEIKCFPDAVDLMGHCSWKNNMQHSEDIKEKCDKQNDGSNLIKFSTTELGHSNDSTRKVSSNGKNKLETYNSALVTENTAQSYNFYKNQEISTGELPTFLNDFKESNAIAKNEIKSQELPVCLNEYVSDTSDNSTNSSDVNSNSFNVDIMNGNTSDCSFQKEMNSSVLPQCLLNVASDSNQLNIRNSSVKPNCVYNHEQNALNSQELPVMVLQYNQQTS